ncbi:Protein CBG24124 [Caenorhabditis briggsae]|uniref:Protein CBG24124 n=1 Tax=Caenorhabditis briggsae TaxID=6238 RepID=A8WK12_CAEBR|nr:Protein CBG24124 [Caenorhabditis briggsae]CAP20805.1 Protein CBG24124 [Caenorhabditis briggsae]
MAGRQKSEARSRNFEKLWKKLCFCTFKSYFETTINIIFCSSSSTEAKMDKTRSSDAVSASSTTAEENNITFN